MGRAALLIGVNRYQANWHLSTDGDDVAELQRVLTQSHLQFESVENLSDRDIQATEAGISAFFRNRNPDDQLFFLFRGYGFQDVDGQLYFLTSSAALDGDGNLLKATALSTSFLQDVMNSSPARQQVVVIDCQVRKTLDSQLLVTENPIEIWDYLNGDGRVILTATTATNHSLVPSNLDAWSYTRYLVEGIETGAADTDGNGLLSAAELHAYVKRKLQIAAPAVQPEIYGSEETACLPLLEVPGDDAALRYRKVLEGSVLDGEVDEEGARLLTGHPVLDNIRQGFRVSPNQAAAIEYEVLRPVRERRQRLRLYQRRVAELQAQEPNEQTHRELVQLQQALSLTDRDIAPTAIASYAAERQEYQGQYQQDLARYEQALLAAMQRQYPITEHDRQVLTTLKQVLGLRDQDVQDIENRITAQIQQLGVTVPADDNQFPTKLQGLAPYAVVPAGVAAAMMPGQETVYPVTASSPAKERIIERLQSEIPGAPGIAQVETSTPVEASPPLDQPAAVTAAAITPRRPRREPAVGQTGRRQSYRSWILPAILLAALIGALLALFSSLSSSNPFRFLLPRRQASNPGLAQQYNSRGVITAKQGNNRQAIEQYNKAIELNPNDPATFINRGIAYHKLGDTDAALKDYNEAIQLEPDSALAYSNRSNVYYDRGDYNQAQNDAKKAIELDPQLAQAYINLANSQLKTAQDPTNRQVQQAAIENYNRAITAQPVRPLLAAVALTNRGNVQLTQNQVTGALRDYNRAIQLNPDYAEAYYNRAIAYQTIGNRQAAISDFSRAADLYTRQGLASVSQDARSKADALKQSTAPPPAS